MGEGETGLPEEIHAVLERARTTDADEDRPYANGDGYCLPETLAHRHHRLDTIRAANGISYAWRSICEEGRP